MAILKIKDENGNFIGVPAITGESGVRLSETEPANENVKVWINPSGETQTIPTMTSELRNDSNFASWNENEVLDETLLYDGWGLADHSFIKFLPKENVDPREFSQLKIIFDAGETGGPHCQTVPASDGSFALMSFLLGESGLIIESMSYEIGTHELENGEYNENLYGFIPMQYSYMIIALDGTVTSETYGPDSSGFCTYGNYNIRHVWGLRKTDRLVPEGWNN